MGLASRISWLNILMSDTELRNLGSGVWGTLFSVCVSIRYLEFGLALEDMASKMVAFPRSAKTSGHDRPDET